MAERGEIIAFPGADKAEDAVRHLHEVATRPGAVASVFAVVFEDGRVDVRCFGDLKISNMALLGSLITNIAVDEYHR